TVNITINAVQDPPVAVPGSNQTANEAATVAFDGSASYDVDGDSLTYAWTFGDGGTATGATPSHVYADNGSFIVTLTVNDGHGNTNAAPPRVTVNTVAPGPAASAPASGVRGQTRTFTFTASDVSSVDQAASFSYAINWGDGSAPQSLSGSAS